MNSRSNLDDRTGIMSENDWRRRQRVLSGSVCKPVPQTRGPDRQDQRPCCGTLLRSPEDGDDGNAISDNALIHDTTAFAFCTGHYGTWVIPARLGSDTISRTCRVVAISANS